ncbi:MAG TPA: hypothetical protein VEH84_00935 [Alphaproteobacteria bacterium]|nr:hypothetical protein [Alphaproteobacteria bacterium]
MVTLFRPKPALHGPADGGHRGHTDAELKAAYDRGRKDEKARHRRSPLLGLGLVVAALVGGTSLVLAAFQGSFREGGALMDAGVSTAAREAAPALKKGAAELQDRIADDSAKQPG